MPGPADGDSMIVIMTQTIAIKKTNQVENPSRLRLRDFFLLLIFSGCPADSSVHNSFCIVATTISQQFELIRKLCKALLAAASICSYLQTHSLSLL